MRSYLSLIPISARVRRRQNLMTRLCIIFAVFLITAVFSMADMDIRMEQDRLMKKHNQEFTFQVIMNTATGQNLMVIAGVLFVLILVAGVLMISSSINSTVAGRTKFFGMMRCIGMDRRQLARFVRLEALNWCKSAIPVGIILGMVSTWILCAVLRFVVKEEFTTIPLFGISPIGIISGIVMGIVTVLIAARAPAQRASRVSLVVAVSGNVESANRVCRPVRIRFFKMETSLGIHHAVSDRKNLILMTASFALSIILFLTFSVLLDFVGYLLPQSASDSEIEIYGEERINCIPYELAETVREMDGVKRVFGRRGVFDIPAELGRESIPQTVDLISFDTFDLEALQKDQVLQKGSDLSRVYGDSGYVLAICDADTPLGIGDTIQVGGGVFTVAGMLKYDIFSEDGLSHGKVSIILSDETFARMTGITDYSLVMIQTTDDFTDENLADMNALLSEDCMLQDQRDLQTSGTYTAFVLCVYGFLIIIAIVTLLNIMNSISMSVSARSRQYGAMRAVGMDGFQITKMIAVETAVYALTGGFIGSVVGIAIGKMLFDILIHGHFAYAVWSLPVSRLSIVVLFVTLSTVAAFYAPSRRMRSMAVTETINEL